MLEKYKLPKDLRQKIRQELRSGENITAIYQPVPRFFTASSIVTVIFAIPWTSFAIFWMWGASLGSSLFSLFGLPFVLIGIAMLLSPIWSWWTAKKTVYLVTESRAILFERGLSTTIRSYAPEQLNDLYRKEKGNGIGDVVIEVKRWKDSDRDIRSKEIGFLGVRNPQEVERRLKQLAQNAG
ncbi:MAG: hypothetical protein ACFBSE_23715 [Prochloraceae cyanobacterium]